MADSAPLSKTTRSRSSPSLTRVAISPIGAAALVALSGCFQVRGFGDGGRLPIIDVQIVNNAEKRQQAAADVPDDALKPTILEMMKGWPDFAFRVARPDEAGWQLTVRLEQLTERTADPETPNVKARSAGMSLQLRALAPVEGERGRYAADLLLTRTEPGSVPIVKLAQDALLKAGDRLMRLRSVMQADDDDVVKALSDDDQAVRLVAIRTAAERKIKSAVPVLIERLTSEAEAGTMIVSVVGALVEMNATEATGAIINTARQQGRSYIVPLLYALARLGGRKAEAYLFTVQSGHPDPVVKQAAEEAFKELEARREKSAP